MKRYLSIVLTLILALSLCACGAKSGSYQAMSAEAPAMAYDYAAGGFSASEEAWIENDFMSESTSANSDAPAVDPEKIIYSADVRIETTEFEKTLEGLNALIKRYGGFVEQSSVNDSDYYNKSRGSRYNRSADYTIRIPSENFSAVMGEMSTLGNVPYSHSYTENISARYYDVKARLEAYQAQEQTLLKLLDKAESIDDIIAVESRLSEVRYMIESNQTTINSWDRQVSYSTVCVDVEEVREYSPEPQESYFSRLGRAITDGFVNVADFFGELLIFLAESLPTLILLGAIVFGVIKAVRAVVKRGKLRKAAKQNKE